MTIFLNDLPSKESVMENMQKMNSFGSRLTGTKGQNAYTAWLKDEIAKWATTWSTSNTRSKMGSDGLVADGRRTKYRRFFPFPLQRTHRRKRRDRQTRYRFQQPVGFPARKGQNCGMPHQKPFKNQQQNRIQQARVRARKP